VNVELEETKANESKIEELKEIPTGQAMLRAGFKLVTPMDLYKRFCCGQIEDRANKKRKEADEKETAEKAKDSDLDESTKLIQPQLGPLTVTASIMKEENLRRLSGTGIMGWFGRETKRQRQISTKQMEGQRQVLGGVMSFGSELIMSANRFRCIVNYIKLDNYVDDKIPDRCYENVKLARSLGATDFEVAFPVLEEVPQLDPVIVTRIGDRMFEIDMWE